MNLLKYKKNRENAFKLVNRKNDVTDTVIYQAQTLSGIVDAHCILDGDIHLASISIGLTVAIWYVFYKSMAPLAYQRFNQSCDALEKTDGSQKEVQICPANGIGKSVLDLDVTIKEAIKGKRDALLMQYLMGVIGACAISDYMEGDVIMAGATGAFAIICTLITAKIAGDENKLIKSASKAYVFGSSDKSKDNDNLFNK